MNNTLIVYSKFFYGDKESAKEDNYSLQYEGVVKQLGRFDYNSLCFITILRLCRAFRYIPYVKNSGPLDYEMSLEILWNKLVA